MWLQQSAAAVCVAARVTWGMQMPHLRSWCLLCVCWKRGWGLQCWKGGVLPCRTQLESHLKAMDVRGLFNHLVAYSSRALWSSDTLVVRLWPPVLTSRCIMTPLYPTSAPSLRQGLVQV